jgi:hypothetical protein
LQQIASLRERLSVHGTHTRTATVIANEVKQTNQRNKKKQNEKKQKETKQKETKRNKKKQKETKRNKQTKRNKKETLSLWQQHKQQR